VTGAVFRTAGEAAALFGPAFVMPALRFIGTNGTVQWGIFRFNAGLRIGVILGPPLH